MSTLSRVLSTPDPISSGGDRTKILIQVSREDLEDLRAVAESTGTSMSSLIRRSLRANGILGNKKEATR